MKQVSKTGDSSRFVFRLSRLVPQAVTYFRKHGFFTTMRKAWMRFRLLLVPPRALRDPLFTSQELERQRETGFSEKLLFSILVPLYNTPESFLREMISSVQAQTYGNWELCLADGSDSSHPEVEKICREYGAMDSRIRYRKLEKNLGISDNTNACLELASGDYISLFDHDDLLHPAALFEVMRTVCETGADFVYTDEAIFIGDLKHIFSVHCKPDFFPDYLRGNNYICHFTSFSRELLNQVGLFQPSLDGSQDHDFILRATEKAKKVVHIPEILYYWRSHPNSVAQDISSKGYAVEAGIKAVKGQLDRLGIPGEVESSELFPSIYHIKYALTSNPLVSVLICGDKCGHIQSCLEAVTKNAGYGPIEILVSGPDQRALRECVAQFPGVRFVASSSRAVEAYNAAASQAKGEQLLFLDSSCIPVSLDWIQELLMYAQRENAGAVAGKIFDSRDCIAHAGLILGYGTHHTVACPFLREPDGSDGYNGRLYYSQEFQAVSPECVMIPRAVWVRTGGFRDFVLPEHYGADLCLRIRKIGCQILWTPYSVLKQVYSPRRVPRKTVAADVRRFQDTWAEELRTVDPFYSPNFKPTGPGFWLK